jgi:hypothetical protein
VSFVLGVRHDEAAVDAAVAALVRAHAAVSGGAGEGRGRWLAASVARAG